MKDYEGEEGDGQMKKRREKGGYGTRYLRAHPRGSKIQNVLEIQTTPSRLEREEKGRRKGGESRGEEKRRGRGEGGRRGYRICSESLQSS